MWKHNTVTGDNGEYLLVCFNLYELKPSVTLEYPDTFHFAELAVQVSYAYSRLVVSVILVVSVMASLLEEVLQIYCVFVW